MSPIYSFKTLLVASFLFAVLALAGEAIIKGLAHHETLPSGSAERTSALLLKPNRVAPGATAARSADAKRR